MFCTRNEALATQRIAWNLPPDLAKNFDIFVPGFVTELVKNSAIRQGTT